MKKFILLCLCLAPSLLAYNAEAGLDTWDPQGASGSATGGTWENTSWDTANQTGTASLVHFVEGDAANFAFGDLGGSASTFTVTMGANHTVAGLFNGPLTPKSCFLTISGGGHIVLPTTGPQGFDTAGSTLGQTTISVIIDGPSTCALETEGGGGLILNGANTYSGGTLIDGGGGVSFGNNAAFGTGAITWQAFGFIQPVGTSAYNVANSMTHLTGGIETFAGNSSGVTFSGPWSLGSSSYVELENIAGTITVSGVISGSAALTITNKGGTWTLTGVNTFTGSLTNAGTLTIGGAGQLNSGSYAGNILNRTNFIYNSSANQTLGGVISGAGTLTQAGSGTLTLSGVETYTGGTSNGTTLTIGGAGTITAAGAITNNGTFNYSSSASETISGIISGTGALNVTSGTLGLSGGANTYSGITTAAGGTLNLANSSGLDAVLGTPPGSPVTNQLVLNNGTLEVSSGNLILNANRGIYLIGANNLTNNGKDATFPDNIAGTGSLTKTGANAAVLSGSNSFSGGLTLLQGTVYFVTNYAAGSGNMTLGPTIGLLTLRITNAAPLQTSVTITNSITVNGGGTKLIDMVSASGDILTFSGQISGNGGLYRGNGGGPGNVALTGNNTNWSGGISLQQGGLIVGNPNALGTGTCTFEPVGSGTTAVILQGNTPLTGVNAITNAVQIAVSNAAEQITIGGSTDLELAGPVILAQAGSLAPVITNNNTGATIISGVISSGVSGTGFTSAGTGILTLNGADTYNGNTAISSGTLALGSSGSINSSPVISIAAGATFDTSANAAYVLSGSTSLSASGTASPATINGALGGTVSLGSQPITLTYDGSHPALTISQGTLVLNGNAFTVNGSVLGVGTYTLISSGSISSSGFYTVTGSAIPAGKVASIQVMGGNVNLVITLETPAFSGLTASQSVIYGTPTVTLSGTLSATSPAIIYPASNETVTVTINGNAQTTTINDTNGDFSLNYNLAGLIYSTSAYPITYSYAGDATLYGATNTSTTLTVTPATAPGITNNPSPQTACGGSPATFTAGASGTNDTYAWYNHANAGWGSAWSATGGGGTFLASSTGNNNGAPDCNTFGSNGDINTPGGNSWGIYGGGSGESVIRTFPATLTDGQVFQVDMDNGGVDNGVQNGFSLQNSTGGFLFSFYFQGGGSDYAYTDGNGNNATSVGYTVTGVRVQVIVGTGSPAAYSLLITPCGGSTVEYSGTFATTNGPGQVVLFNNNPYGGSANDLYFNSMFAGGAYDNADNYTNGGWNGVDAGDAAPIAGATNATYTTSSGNNGDQYYAIVGNGAGFAASSTALLTVNPPPTVSVNSATLCAGGSAMLTATTSASSPSYLWSPGGATTVSITVSPASTTVYTVTVTDGTTGCMNSGSGTVTVNPLPTVSVNSAAVCVGGGPRTLTATTSASNPSYLWSDSETNASITVSPASTTTYTVMVTDGTTGCTNSGSGTVTVNPLPTVSVNSASLCAGGSAMLTATTSASSPSYLWSDSETNASITVSPASTTVYTVTVTDGTTGCANSGSGTVTVNPLPTVSVNSTAVCAGDSAMLTATTSASSPSYLWSDSETTASITVSPASTTTYTVTVTDGTTGCMNSGSGTVTINPLPTLTLATNAILVDYGSTNASLAYTGTSGSPDGYSITYDTNAQAAGFSNVTLTALPASPITLTVPALAAGTNVYNGTLIVNYSSNGCGSTNYEFTVTVTPLPVNLTGARAYDGTNDANSSILTIANDLDGTNLTLSGSAVLAGSGLGPQSISDFSGLTLGGSAATNYTLAGASGSVTISAATPAFTNLTASQAITYGTASITLTGTVSAPGPVYPTNGETITVTINGNPQTTTISDGMGDFTINYTTGTIPANSGFPYYTITYSYAGDTNLSPASDTSTTLEVDSRPVVLVGTKVYDGTTDAPAIILSVVNAVNGDMVTVVSGDATMVSANVGTNAIYMGTLQLGGASGYTITGGVGTVVVTMAPLTITANNDSKVYGQVKTYGAGSGAFTSSALQNGETIGTVTITASGGTAANAPIGMYNLLPSAATGGTFSPGNYAITYNPGTLTVSVLTAILTGTRPYDGTAIATNSILTVSNAVAGDDVTVASGSGTLASDAVGTNLITSLGSLALGGTTATNYTLSGALGAVVITDSGLPFSITSFTLVGTNLVTVFQSVPGDVYQLLGSANAAAPLATWTNVGGSITASNTSTTNIIPINVLNNSESYIYKNLR